MLAVADALVLAEDLAGFEHDPLGYVLWNYPWGVAGTELADEAGPRAWQRECLELVRAHLEDGATVHQAIQLAVASGHGIGKSALLAWLCRWAVATREDTRGVVTANTDTQLRTKTWPEFAKWHRLALDRDLFVCTATSLHSADPAHERTWRLDAVPWSENNTEAFAGLHNKGKRLICVFDEASKIADRVWEVTEGALTDEGTEIIWAVFGNGTRATGRFRECFRKFRHRWLPKQIDARTVEGTNKTQIQKWIDDWGEDSDFVKIRVRGEFPSASARQFISTDLVDAAAKRHLRPEQYAFAPKILGVDPAWTGDDPFVIGLRQGLLYKTLASVPKNDDDVAMANLIARLEDEHQVDAVFIDGGFGTGIVSIGRTLQRNWVLVWFSGTADDAGDVNKRASMWRHGRQWLIEGGAIDPADQQLRDDLIGPETEPRLDGKLLLESKEDMKTRGIPSPNRGDAWALTFAHPVRPKALQNVAGGRAIVSEYDPFANA